jgi:phage antirepressor YoqD-like protein
MKTLRQISKAIGISEQRLHYYLNRADAIQPLDLRKKKWRWVRYYDEQAVIEYCKKKNPAMFQNNLINIRQAAKIIGIRPNKLMRKLKKPNAPACLSKGYRHLYDKDELLTWWNELK